MPMHKLDNSPVKIARFMRKHKIRILRLAQNAFDAERCQVYGKIPHLKGGSSARPGQLRVIRRKANVWNGSLQFIVTMYYQLTS